MKLLFIFSALLYSSISQASYWTWQLSIDGITAHQGSADITYFQDGDKILGDLWPLDRNNKEFKVVGRFNNDSQSLLIIYFDSSNSRIQTRCTGDYEVGATLRFLSQGQRPTGDMKILASCSGPPSSTLTIKPSTDP